MVEFDTAASAAAGLATPCVYFDGRRPSLFLSFRIPARHMELQSHSYTLPVVSLEPLTGLSIASLERMPVRLTVHNVWDATEASRGKRSLIVLDKRRKWSFPSVCSICQEPDYHADMF